MNDDTEQPPPQEISGTADAELGVAPEVSRRVGSILDAVEREAQRLREEARAEASRYLEHARWRADGLVAERQRRIAALSDELIGKSEDVVARLDDAAPVRQGFENLVRALGDAAERLSRETEVSSQDFELQPFHESAAAPLPPAPEQVPPPPAPAQSAPPAAYQPRPAEPARAIEGDPRYGLPTQPHPARAPSTPGWQNPPAAAPPGGTRPPPGSSGWRQLDDARMVAIQLASTGATRAGVREHLHRALAIADTGDILDEIFGGGTGEDARVPWAAGPR